MRVGLKLDIFNPKMLHKCPHGLGDNSNPIEGHRWSIDAQWRKLRWPSMGVNGVSVLKVVSIKTYDNFHWKRLQ